MKTYFTQDGSYGNAERLLIIDTTDWSPQDWHKVEACSDYERFDIAQQTKQEKEETTMTTQQQLEKLLEALPNATIDTDNDGQIIIYTDIYTEEKETN